MISVVVGIHYYNFFTNNHVLYSSQISDESSRKEKNIMNDGTFVCNIWLAVTTNLLAN